MQGRDPIVAAVPGAADPTLRQVKHTGVAQLAPRGHIGVIELARWPARHHTTLDAIHQSHEQLAHRGVIELELFELRRAGLNAEHRGSPVYSLGSRHSMGPDVESAA